MSVRALTLELIERLRMLQSIGTEVAELSDSFIEVSAGLSPGEYAELSLLLRDARDAASQAKSRCSAVRDRVNAHFVVAITDEGETQYEGDTHTFYAGADGYFNAPSPSVHPEKFAELYAWLIRQGYEPNRVLFGKRELSVLCKERMKEGEPLPPHVREHTIASVVIRKKTT